MAVAPTLADVRAAAAALRRVVYRTPLVRAGQLLGGERELYLKAENLQRTGSFKVRGAYNRIRQLSPRQKRRGVVTASAGNHAQGVALSAAAAGVTATIVMPRHAPLIKVTATRALGAEVELVGDTFEEALAHAWDLCRQRGAAFVHAFDDPAVIAGQGTIGLEILADLPRTATVVVPIGGGGLIGGIGLAVKALRPDVRVIGVEPEGAAAAFAARRAGRLVPLERVATIADGLAVKEPSPLTFSLIERYVDDIVLVSEDEIVRAIVTMLERAKLLAEGAGAVGVAAVLAGKVPPAGDGETVVVVSGGNIDINVMARMIERGLVQDGRYLRLRTLLADRPGSLHRLLGVVAAEGANIITVAHDRLNPGVALGETEVQLVVETRDRSHATDVVQALQRAGYN
ncbi:MAG TPA: threonine ammonia-lyase, partial [Bacillota bacterium]